METLFLNRRLSFRRLLLAAPFKPVGLGRIRPLLRKSICSIDPLNRRRIPMPVASARKVASKILRCPWQEKVARIPCGGPLKTIQERIGQEASPCAAQKLGDSIAKAVADAERNSDNFDCLTATKEKSFHSQKMEVF